MQGIKYDRQASLACLILYGRTLTFLLGAFLEIKSSCTSLFTALRNKMEEECFEIKVLFGIPQTMKVKFLDFFGKKLAEPRLFSEGALGFEITRHLREIYPSGEPFMYLKTLADNELGLMEPLKTRKADATKENGRMEIEIVCVSRLRYVHCILRDVCDRLGYSWVESRPMEIAVFSKHGHPRVYVRPLGGKTWLLFHMVERAFIPFCDVRECASPPAGAQYDFVDCCSLKEVFMHASECTSGRYNYYFNNCQHFTINLLKKLCGGSGIVDKVSFSSRWLMGRAHQNWRAKIDTDCVFPEQGEKWYLTALILWPF